MRTDPDWEKWDFAKLFEAVRLWTTCNPIDQNRTGREKEKQFFVGRKARECVYCGEKEHKVSNCDKVIDVTERKQALLKKRLCFNCVIGNHRAADCPSKTNCQICNKRRHTSICDSTNSREKALTTNQQASDGVFPVLVIKVNGVKCRALIDSGSGSSYISAKLVNILKAKPVESQMKQVEMLMYSKRVHMETYKLDVESLDGKHEMKVKFIKVDKGELLPINNPHYAELIRDNSHLSKVIIADNDKRSRGAPDPGSGRLVPAGTPIFQRSGSGRNC